MNAYDGLIFELSVPGRVGYSLPESDVPEADPGRLLPAAHLRGRPAALPEVSEFDAVRHYTRLSRMNFGVDTHFYPLGSCTMKYNPKINEDMARLPGFARLHPLTPEDAAQGALQLMGELGEMLAEIVGMDATSLQPAAGAQGEMTGVLSSPTRPTAPIPRPRRSPATRRCRSSRTRTARWTSWTSSGTSTRTSRR